MDTDLVLLEKEVFKEVILDGEFETIAVWSDGDWSIISSVHYEEKVEEGYKPVYYLRKSELTSDLLTTDHIDELIAQIEQEINGFPRLIQDSSN